MIPTLVWDHSLSAYGWNADVLVTHGGSSRETASTEGVYEADSTVIIGYSNPIHLVYSNSLMRFAIRFVKFYYALCGQRAVSIP